MNLEDFRTTVQVPSGEISYIDVGEGPVALFIHGIGTNACLWRNVIGDLHDERRRIAIDLPLHGRSPARPDQDFSLSALAGVVEEVCAALDLSEIDLVANDTGGAIAQIFAARHPERLRTFTLTNCEAHDNVPPEALKPLVALAARGELAPTAGHLLANLDLARSEGSLGGGYERPDQVSDETLRGFLEPVLGTPERARQFERWLTALSADDLLAVEPELQRLTVPTLVVWGTGDVFFAPKWASWLRDTIPGVTDVVEIEGARTFFPDERPGDLVPHLRRHWAAHAAATV
jgi:pimeloyl-ACP methyl ester carboxylesterase